jgi:hypothetical protein
VKLLPKFNMKREVWPGGPKVGEVIEAKLSPPPRPAAGTEPPEAATASINLLLLLR